MNLQEAIKSGRRFKRKSALNQYRWYFVDHGYLKFHQEPLGEMIETIGLADVSEVADLLADDWVIEETYKNIKPSQIWQAIQKYIIDFKEPQKEFENILNKLGFPEDDYESL